MADQTFLGTAELAALLCVSPKVLRNLAEDPEAPALHVGAGLRWPVDLTLEWLRRRRPARKARTGPKGAESAPEIDPTPKVVEPASEANEGLKVLDPPETSSEEPNVAADPFMAQGVGRDR